MCASVHDISHSHVKFSPGDGTEGQVNKMFSGEISIAESKIEIPAVKLSVSQSE